MSVVTKQEWIDWKSSPVTKAFMLAMVERVKDAKDILSVSAGLDPVSDNFYRGFIAAYTEAQDFHIDDLSEDE